jgi:3-deoxy-D-arabino-heptulosonate 7-phosphate (DAHP) synthase
VEIKTRKLFKELVKKLTMELLDEEGLEEITTTAAVPGYQTPYAFSGKGDKEKKKKRLKKSTGYKFVTEALDNKDLKQITKLIRNVVGDILRDIWLKRNAWK